MNEDFLQQLSEVQRAAVEYLDGPQLVIAGAGSGKTRVLTYKIAYLLKMGIPAYNILALTFTNKAAREMKERICRIVPATAARYLWMGTFHAICARILRTEANVLGFTHDFTIYDTADSKSLLKQIIKQQKLDEKIYKPAMVLGRLSMAKNALIAPNAYNTIHAYREQDNKDRLYQIAEIYQEYQFQLQQANAMDFDDLLVNMYRLLQHAPEICQKYQHAFQYILVDEYQDTNYVQYLLIKMLAEPQNRICVVGDDAQSIYSFRGADIRNILGFQQTYSNAKLFKLERNYRSTQNIVQAANSLIHHNEHQIHKEVYSEKEQGQRIELVVYTSDLQEGEGLAKAIEKEHRIAHVKYEDIAVLYRTNAQSRTLENELRKRNIPYRIYGGTSFYQRKEIKDAIAYFRLAVNPKDNEALLRVINFPARGIGDTTLRKIIVTATQHHSTLMDVVANPQTFALPVQKGTLKKLETFTHIIAQITQAAEVKDAYEFVEFVYSISGVMTAAMADTTSEGRERAENLQELLSAIREFVERRVEEGIDFTPIADFLAEVSLLTDQDQNIADTTERITLMTVHAAKGLEYSSVYITGLEENLFPSQYCTKPYEIEEERRLLYVAITRAMDHCTLSYAKQRYRNGSLTFTSPSRFIDNIDRKYLSLTTNTPVPPIRTRWNNNTWGDEEEWNPIIAHETYQTTPQKTLKRVEPNTQSAPTNCSFLPNERVYHRTFGEGTVLRAYRENENDKIQIQFDKVGTKTLLLTYAKLEKR